MNKREKAKYILKLVGDRGLSYEVLSKSGSTPNHIRVNGFGDIWPSTATHMINGKWYKKDLSHLIQALGGEAQSSKKSKAMVLIEQLISRVEELESKVAFLEMEKR